MTVLFYDIVGSTSLAVSHDPESMRDTLNRIHSAARQVVTKHGGSLEQLMGDGGMAYFGFPIISEDAALQAVQAGLDLLAERARLDNAPGIRVGIATSLVVLPNRPEAMAAGGLGAVGVAPNLAARLESAAPVNEVLVGPATQAITRRAVHYEPVDGLTLKGFPDVKRAWRPVSVRPVESRFARDRDASGHLSGRSDELRLLQDAWTQTRNGAGCAVLVTGEPGIGKSRLVAELVESAEDGRIVAVQCQPRTEGEALFSIIRMYENAHADGSDPDLAAVAVRTAERVRDLEEDRTLSAEALREAIVTAVEQEFESLSRLAPVLLVAEDLHWADEVTLAVLDRLSVNVAHNPIFILGMARPSERLATLEGRYRKVGLEHIAATDARALVDARSDADLSPSTRDWIVEKADGNPLFLIELTCHACDLAALGTGSEAMSGADVGTLRDLLAARLDCAGEAKRTAQIASILGREYPYRLLSRLEKPYDNSVLDADLQRLVDHGLKEAVGDGHAYAFRHALIRDIAYDSQLRSIRRALHGQVVDLVQREPGLAADVPDILLAEHCMAAGRIRQGLSLLLDVAEDAIRRSARHAPRKMLERVLDEAERVEEPEARDLLELRAIALLGPLVTLADGHRDARPLYERGQAIYFRLAPAKRAPFFPVLWGWWFTASDLVEQTQRSEILIRDVREDADPESRLQALHCGWATLFDGGAHERCLAAIADGLALYDEEVAQKSRYLYGHDARVCGLGERALCAWFLGELETSAAAIGACEDWGDATGQLASQLHGLDIATQLAVFNHDLPEIDRILTRIEALSGSDMAPAIAAKRKIFAGWSATRRGARIDAETVADGLRSLRDCGVLEDVPFYADIAAEVTAAAGDRDGALGPLEDEIAAARDTGLTFWLPELLRRKALLTSGAGRVAALDEGLETARAQNARMLILRNIATRQDLDLAVPPEELARLEDMLGQVSDCSLRKKVLDGLRR